MLVVAERQDERRCHLVDVVDRHRTRREAVVATVRPHVRGADGDLRLTHDGRIDVRGRVPGVVHPEHARSLGNQLRPVEGREPVRGVLTHHADLVRRPAARHQDFGLDVAERSTLIGGAVRRALDGAASDRWRILSATSRRCTGVGVARRPPAGCQNGDHAGNEPELDSRAKCDSHHKLLRAQWAVDYMTVRSHH